MLIIFLGKKFKSHLNRVRLLAIPNIVDKRKIFREFSEFSAIGPKIGMRRKKGA